MYLIFIGTTDYLGLLHTYLQNVPHTMLQGSGAWQGNSLNAQVVIMFNEQDAIALRKFMCTVGQQKEVIIHKVTTEELI